MTAVLLVAALAVALPQDRGTRPPDSPESPAVPGAATAREPADFAGTWTYDDDESVNAATGRPESARAVNERRGAGRGPAGSPTPTPSRRGAPAGGTGSLAGMGGVSQETLYNLYIMQRDTQRDLMEIAPMLRLDVTSTAVTITDDLDRVLTFPTNGKKQKYQLGAAVFDAKTYWDAGQLKMDIEGPDGLRITETWFLSEGGSRMYLIIRVGDPVKGQPPVGVNRVYNRVD